MKPHKEDKKAHLFVQEKYTYILKMRKRICILSFVLESATAYI